MMHVMKGREGLIKFLGSLALAAALGGCHHIPRNETHPGISDENIQQGKELATRYCQGCHLLPDPSLLDATTWEKGVLPFMGPRLGIFSYQLHRYPSSRYDRFLDPHYYPSSPMLKPEEWGQIMDYYMGTAPDSLPSQARPRAIQNGLTLFKPVTPLLAFPSPTTAYVHIDTSRGRSIFCADAITKRIFRLNSQLQPVDSLAGVGTIVDLDFSAPTLVATDIGLMNPNNGLFGKAEQIGLNAEGKMVLDSTALFSTLARPVQITASDLNGDGKTDYLVCEFGNLTGSLSWMENLGNHQFKHNVITPIPGAIKAYIRDENKDGLPDLWVLFAQGDERISLFTNLGHGNFSERKVLRFPPSYGSSYFELADFNHDGNPDIVYTCGDNADFSEVLKPYHGVYIFLNDGKNNFTQKYFFPINGCYKAMARDFDGDGDLDLAVISFFADYSRQPEEGFVYLENRGDFNFQPYSLPEATVGRWLTMDVGDLDGDGRPDIVLGNFSIAPSFISSKTDWTQGPPFLFLKNIGSHP